MKNLLIALAACAALAACQKPAEQTTHAGNGFEVSRLFSVDGCTVYRFQDAGTRYFAKCSAASATTNSNENCGKNCTHTRIIPTETE